jgi:opacity protein-like surface antigen
MKTMFAAAALVAATLAFAAPAAAAETYISVGAGSESMDFSGLGVGAGTANIPVVIGRVGWKSDQWFGAEADLAFGVGSSDIAPGVKVKLNSAAAIYGVAFIPVGKKADFILRAGYGHQAGKVEAGGGSTDTNDGAFSYGVGADYKFKSNLSLRGDYTRVDIDGVDTGMWTLSVAHSF